MLTRIESADNNRLKLVRKLSNKKTRDDEGKFVIEGVNLVEEAIIKGVAIDFILVSDKYSERKIFERVSEHNQLVFEIPAPTFEKLSDAENGVGVLAVVNKSNKIIDDFLQLDKNILILDRVQDPGNIGTMVRTAVAAGYGLILAIKGTADVYSAKVLRSTAGMIFDIPILYINDSLELKNFVSKSGHKLVVTDPYDGKAYYEEDLHKNIALVIGNEGNGISKELMNLADVRVTIPMMGEIESLNAAISAAILMYETIRKK